MKKFIFENFLDSYYLKKIKTRTECNSLLAMRMTIKKNTKQR